MRFSGDVSKIHDGDISRGMQAGVAFSPCRQAPSYTDVQEREKNGCPDKKGLQACVRHSETSVMS